MVKMQNSKINPPAGGQNLPVKNPLETLRGLDGNNFDQFFDNFDQEDNEFGNFAKVNEKKAKKDQKKFKIFDYQQYSETTLIKKQISELTELIKKEINLLKRDNSSLLNEIGDIENLTINALPEKPGIYHVRFLEIILSMIKNIRAKVGESKTWMEAMITKKKKRGSLFAVRSKKQGTLYSLSQELQSARSVQ